MPTGMFDLTGKVAIVTGGNGGIGLGIALGLARHGSNIVVAARNQEKTKSAVNEIEALGVNAIGLTTEVQDETSVAKMVQSTLDEFGT